VAVGDRPDAAVGSINSTGDTAAGSFPVIASAISAAGVDFAEAAEGACQALSPGTIFISARRFTEEVAKTRLSATCCCASATTTPEVAEVA
jgi:hypothetical protein